MSAYATSANPARGMLRHQHGYGGLARSARLNSQIVGPEKEKGLKSAPLGSCSIAICW